MCSTSNHEDSNNFQKLRVRERETVYFKIHIADCVNGGVGSFVRSLKSRAQTIQLLQLVQFERKIVRQTAEQARLLLVGLKYKNVDIIRVKR